MEFCSKYGYDYGFSGSDSEEISDEENETEKKTTRRFRQADSNIIAVKFDSLVEPNEMHQSKPIVCKKCEAFLSLLSTTKKENDKTEWTCEFCQAVNILETFNENELPKQDDVTYLLESAPRKKVEFKENIEEKSKSMVSTDDSYFTLCMDISGSMDTIIKDQMTRLDGVKLACIENLERLKIEEPNKRVSLVTFSQDVKFYGDCSKSKPIVDTQKIKRSNSLLYQIQKPKSMSPKRPQSTVFNSIVKKASNIFTLGPSSNPRLRSQVKNSSRSEDSSEDEEEDLTETREDNEDNGDILENKKKMLKLAVNQDGNLKGISESSEKILNRVKQMRTEGATALGPGLVFSIGFSGKKSGSQIILCTDGCANVGMGSMNGYSIKNNDNFYDILAEDAKERGVTVNVISMEGTDCKLSMLGRVADKTNGSLEIVNPLNLGEQFKSILKNRIVATNVKAKLIVNNKFLYIRDEELEVAESKAIEANDMAAKEELNSVKKSVCVKDIGNANIDTEITFEYGIRKLEEKSKEEKLEEMPFQLQISYTANDGSTVVRVYTKIQKFSSDRKVVEDNLEQDLLWMNAAQKMSSHFLSANTVVAKYKSRQMKNYQEKRKGNLQAPREFLQRNEMIDKSSKHRTVNDLADCEAQQMFSGKKVSRSKMKQ